MKQLIEGILMIIGSIIVFTLPIIVGAMYQVGHSFFMAYVYKDWTIIFKSIWNQIDGTIAFVGQTLKDIATNYDILANVHGEWLEDSITTEENTPLGKKGITMSASIGWIKYTERRLFLTGKWLDNALNFLFQETNHTVGSWLKKIENDKIWNMNLRGRKKFKKR